MVFEKSLNSQSLKELKVNSLSKNQKRLVLQSVYDLFYVIVKL